MQAGRAGLDRVTGLHTQIVGLERANRHVAAVPVGEHLRSKGVCTPRLICTVPAASDFVELTWDRVEGRPPRANRADVMACARLLARIHEALKDYDGASIHGDFHPGNVLFPLDGGPPVVLDLEDTWRQDSYLLDVAFALDRFVTQRFEGESRDMAEALFLDTYADVRGFPVPRHKLPRWRRQMAVYALHAMLDAGPGEWDALEWRKQLDCAR